MKSSKMVIKKKGIFFTVHVLSTILKYIIYFINNTQIKQTTPTSTPYFTRMTDYVTQHMIFPRFIVNYAKKDVCL